MLFPHTAAKGGFLSPHPPVIGESRCATLARRAPEQDASSGGTPAIEAAGVVYLERFVALVSLDLRSRDFVNPVRPLWRAIAQMVYGTAKNAIAPAPKGSAGTATSVYASVEVAADQAPGDNRSEAPAAEAPLLQQVKVALAPMRGSKSQPGHKGE